MRIEPGYKDETPAGNRVARKGAARYDRRSFLATRQGNDALVEWTDAEGQVVAGAKACIVAAYARSAGSPSVKFASFATIIAAARYA